LVFDKGCGSFTIAHSRFRQGWDVKSIPRYHVMIEKDGAKDYSIIANNFSSAGTGCLLDKRLGSNQLPNGNFGT